MTTYVIQSIVFFDGMGGQVMSQMTLHFHILFRDFKAIGTESADSDEYNSEEIRQDLRSLIKRHQELLE